MPSSSLFFWAAVTVLILAVAFLVARRLLPAATREASVAFAAAAGVQRAPESIALEDPRIGDRTTPRATCAADSKSIACSRDEPIACSRDEPVQNAT